MKTTKTTKADLHSKSEKYVSKVNEYIDLMHKEDCDAETIATI